MINDAPYQSFTKRQRYAILEAQLRLDRNSFESHWQDLGDHFAPHRYRKNETDRNKGGKKFGKIVNETGMLAARTARSGMFAGMSSPARPWRRLTTPDPDLADFAHVKSWLSTINSRMTSMTRKSNIYQVLPVLYGDELVFGGGAIGIFPDQQDLMRCYSYPIGSYWLAANDRGVVDTFMYRYQMTVRQVVMKFGDPRASEAEKWKPFSLHVKSLFEAGNYEQTVYIMHVVTPNMEYDPRRLAARYAMPYSSCFYEEGQVGNYKQQISDASTQGFLRESGLPYFPILAPQWERAGEDTYGTTCPGMEALGTCKEIQTTEKRLSRAIEKQLNPPMQGPSSLRNQRPSLIAGDFTAVDTMNDKGGLRPVHEVRMAIEHVDSRILRMEQRIDRIFYVDMFLMLDRMQGIQPRSEAEIAERHEEKLIALGPVLESNNDGLFDPLTDIQFFLMQQAGMIPEPPEELADQDLKIEYESIMAKAQKLVGVAGTERFIGFLGNVAAAKPEVLDRINEDELVDEYGDSMGVSTKIIRPLEEAEQIRQQRAMQQAKQQAMQTIGAGAQAAQQLSEADTSTDNVLTRMLAGA